MFRGAKLAKKFSCATIMLILSTGISIYAQEPFYKGKTIRIIVATSAGGGFDTYTRAIARYMGRHIPGHPGIIVENMAGAGHLIGANHLYKVAKPDGITLGHFQGGLVFSQLFNQPGIEFDILKFEFIGAPVMDTRTCAFTKASGITSMEKWMASKTPVKVGGIGAGATEDIPRMLKATLGLPIQLVSGYKGTAEIRLAAESGELAGGCWTWESMRATWTKAMESGDAVVVLQILSKPHSELAHVPLAVNYAKSEEARQLIKAGIQDPADYYRPYVLPPGTPKERVQIMRKAFHDTMKDPEFLAEARKAKLDVDPVTGEELEKTLRDLFKLNPSLLAKLKEILTAK